SSGPEGSRDWCLARLREEEPPATRGRRGAAAGGRPRQVRFRQGTVRGTEEVVDMDEGPRRPKGGSNSETGIDCRQRHQGTATDSKKTRRVRHFPSESSRRPRSLPPHRRGRGMGPVPEGGGPKEPVRYLPAAVEGRVRHALYVCRRGRLWGTRQQRLHRTPGTCSYRWNVILRRPRRFGLHNGCGRLV